MIGGKNISDLLMRLYACPVNGDFFKHVLTVLEEFLPATISGYSMVDLETRYLKKEIWRNHSGGEPLRKELLNRLYQKHPFMDYYCSNSLGPVICTTDIMSEDEWRQTELYDVIHRQLGVVHETSIRFYIESQCHCFEFSGQAPLDDDRRRMLNLAAPHLCNAYRAYELLQEGFIAGFPDEMSLLSKKGSLLKCPDLVVDLLNKYYPGMQANKHRLPDPVQHWVNSQIEEGMSNSDFSTNEQLIAMTGDQILTLLLVRHSAGLILLFEESARIRPIHILLDLGLTRREAEVLMWIVQGKQNGEIATILAISTATVRKHVEHVLQKLGCENRGAAALLVMQYYAEQLNRALPEACYTCSLKECKNCIEEYSSTAT